MMDYKNLFNLEGKRAVVIGGNGGIGSAIAEGFAACGVKVIITGRNQEKTQAKADEINSATGTKNCFAVASDASKEADVEALASKTKELIGGIDILVNSQGLNKKAAVIEQDVDVWDEMFGANVRSIMLTCKHFGPMMIEQKWGRVINIASIGAVRTKNNDTSTAYGATKGAVNALSLNLSAGWAQYGITVNCIAPIMTETPMMTAMPIWPQLKEGTAARVPAGRIGQPEDCAKLALFFASDAADFVTGQILYPDGGLLTQQ